MHTHIHRDTVVVFGALYLLSALDKSLVFAQKRLKTSIHRGCLLQTLFDSHQFLCLTDRSVLCRCRVPTGSLLQRSAQLLQLFVASCSLLRTVRVTLRAIRLRWIVWKLQLLLQLSLKTLRFDLLTVLACEKSLGFRLTQGLGDVYSSSAITIT